MKHLLFSLFFVSQLFTVNAQDILVKKNSDKLEVKIVEIGLDVVKYKKFNNLDGPVYLIKKENIKEIRYKNGDKEIFSSIEVNENMNLQKSSNVKLSESFKQTVKKGSKVFIDSNNSNAKVHAARKLKQLGYWTITKDEKLADFILYFDVEMFWNSASGYAEFKHPKTEVVLYKTNNRMLGVSRDLNLKRGIIYAIVDRDIIPLIMK